MWSRATVKSYCMLSVKSFKVPIAFRRSAAQWKVLKSSSSFGDRRHQQQSKTSTPSRVLRRERDKSPPRLCASAGENKLKDLSAPADRGKIKSPQCIQGGWRCTPWASWGTRECPSRLKVSSGKKKVLLTLEWVQARKSPSHLRVSSGKMSWKVRGCLWPQVVGRERKCFSPLSETSILTQ